MATLASRASLAGCLREKGRWSLFVWLMLLAVVVPIDAVAAQQPERPEVAERQVKAAYLYKFASYVRWPADSFAHERSPIVIGVIGADPIAADLARMVKGKSVDGRPLVARRIRTGQSLKGLHILFVGRMSHSRLAETIAATRGQPLLVVSDSQQAQALGSMVNFVVVDQRLRFEVALGPVSNQRLKLSALMLTAAHEVRPGEF